jgi:hypothetical protein
MPDVDGRDLQQLRYSPSTRRLLTDLQETDQIKERVDGFRLAVTLAVALGCNPRREQSRQDWSNYAAANTIDTDDAALRTVITEVFPEFRNIPYRAIEDLAEQGAQIIEQQYLDGDKLMLPQLLDTVAQAGPRSA